MATLDNVNLFANGGPTSNSLEDEYQKLVAVINSPGIMGTPPTFEEFVAMRQKQQAADTARRTMTEELGSGNIKKAYEEGFTQLPILEQLGTYVFPPTGVPIETYETGYFADQAGFGMKSPQEFAIDVLNPNTNIFQKLPVKAEDPMSAVLAPLSALGALGGIGELANIPKAGLMALRRFQQKSMDGGGGGGIGGLPVPKQETTKDLAGYKSNVLEEAKAVSDELSPKALLQYLKSNKRTNPSNNKTGTALKQTEIDEIDFDAFEAEMKQMSSNYDYTNEDILQYIDNNRVQLYRVSRSESPTYTSGGGSDSIELELNEPLTQQIRDKRNKTYFMNYNTFANQQLEFMQNNFPDGINKQNYWAFVERQIEFNKRRDIDTSGRAPSQLTEAYLSNNDITENPFVELGVSQYDVFQADGIPIDIDPTTSYEDFLDALDKGYTLKPRILDQNVADNIADDAAASRTDADYEVGVGDEAYRYVGGDNIYEVVGSESNGYIVNVNGATSNYFDEFIPLDEARIQIQQREADEGFISSGIGKYDDYTSNDALIDVLPSEVIDGSATIPTKYDDYDSFRLPMGGATDYQEHTIHVKNPKTSRRYTSGDGTKHFGGGDELFHLRTTIRTDENGKEVLFVEEIQSDLHSTARSTQNDATYELPAKKRQEIAQKIDKLVGDTERPFVYLRDDNTIRISDELSTTNMDARQLIRSGDMFLEREGFVRKGIIGEKFEKLVEYNGRDKMVELLKIIEPFRDTGNLPNFPYKGNAWVDAAVKEAIKIGAEQGVDRVAFTNAATQIGRNNKSLNYVQDKIITKVPTREEILASDEFADLLSEDMKTAYEDFIDFGDVPITSSKFVDMPKPTKKEFYADMPNKRKRVNVLSNQISDTIGDMYRQLDKDVTRFRQKYPEVHSDNLVLDELDGTARGVIESYQKLADLELQVLSDRANVDLDVLSDPRNIDVTNPALARLLDADLSFREKPKFINDSTSELRQLADEKNYLNSFLEYDDEKIKTKLLDRLESGYGTGQYEYKLENVGYELEGDEILNPQKIQMEGEDYDNQRFGQRMLTNEEELLGEVPEQFREQVKKDLAAGKSNISLNIDDLEGSGKKFLEIYKNGITKGINETLKGLKIKDVKPSISNVLYASDPGYGSVQLFSDFKYLKRKNEFELDEFYDTLNQEPYRPTSAEQDVGEGLMLHKSIGIDLTDEMREKILREGLPSMYMGGKVTKSNSMDRPIEGNRREM